MRRRHSESRGSRRGVGGERGFAVQVVSEQALLARFGDPADPAVPQALDGVLRQLERSRPDWLVDCVPAWGSLLVIFDPGRTDASVVRRAIRAAAAARADASPVRRSVTVPVWYDPEVAPDLEEVARRHGLSVEEVIARHAGRPYTVYALGFKPGFPYLGFLDDALVTPRRDTPRLSVPPGSVAIAGRQTGIYPVRSPGGWWILGRTPVRIFDPQRPEPFLLGVGQVVRFQPIDRCTYEELGGETGRVV
jgi:inhibitor of KinA